MTNVDSRGTLRLITKRFMNANRKRNIIAVIAITLTALLFTTLFTGSQSLILSKRAAEIRQFMSSSHAVAQDMTRQQAEIALTALKTDRDIDRYGRGIFLGGGMNREFDFSTEVRFADEAMAESYNCMPTSGHLPQKQNEIAVSTLILDRLGLPHKLGQHITVTWEKEGASHKTQTDEFVVSGFWQGDKAVIAQLLFVSESYAEKNAASPSESEIAEGYFNGSYDFAVWYSNLWGLDKKTEKLSKQAGLLGKDSVFEVNPAYSLSGEDSFSFGSVAVLLLFIMLAGYLIIYNVFSLSVRTDIRAYGLLKNVGTTGKQLKKIVRMQALILSAIGIPIGIAAGYLAAICMAPSLNAGNAVSAQDAASSVVVVNASPVIFAAAAVFTLITVYLSCFQSCRIVEKVSPVEALRLAEDNTMHKRKAGIKNKSFSAGWCKMAFRNMLRDWKKGLIVMVSIALSMLVVNCIVMLVNGYDFDSYKKIFLSSDFKIDQMTSLSTTTNFEGVTPGVQQELEACPYSKATGYVYYSPEKHTMESSLKKNCDKFAEEYKSYWSDYELKKWSGLQSSGKIDVHFLGISKCVFDTLEWKDKPCSWSDFKTCKYVITDYNRYLEPEYCSYYTAGDSFEMEYSSGQKKQYTVLGEAAMPYAIDYPYADTLYITVMVPEDEFKACTGINSAMYAVMDAKKGQEKQAAEYLEKTVLKDYDMLNVFSILMMKESFQKYVSKYYSVGAFLVIILLGIAVMNFFNTTAVSVLSRKRELTLLEAVGMARRQIIWMLIAEGCIYFIGAFIIAIFLVCFTAEKLLSHTVGQAFFFNMHLTVMPCVCMIPLFFIIAVLIPYYQYRKLGSESIVDRLRSE